MAGPVRDEEIVAFHEAAHAVIALHLGARLSNLRIEREKCDDEQWTGNVQSDLGHLPKASTAITAFAGALSDMKVMANRAIRESQNTAEITIPEESLPRILATLLRVHDFEHFDSDEIVDRVPIDVLFAGERCTPEDEVSLTDCEGDIDVAIKAIGRSHRHLEPCLFEARELIDNPEIWMKIQTLAQLLMTRESRTFFRKEFKEFNEEEVNKLMRSGPQGDTA